MKRLIDWFRKPAIMSKLINTAGMFDGDFVTYKHHKYYVNCQTGVVIRIEQCIYIQVRNHGACTYKYIDNQVYSKED